jgi:ATP-binding cassette subfamily B multidrug efflux pump
LSDKKDKPPQRRINLAERGRRFEKAKEPNKVIRRLLEYLKPYKIQLTFVTILIIASTLLSLVTPFLIGRTIDVYIIQGDIQGLQVIVIWLLVLFIFNWVLQAAQGWIMSTITQNSLKGIRQEVFDHLQELDLAFFDKTTSGELMSRITNDIEAISTALTQNITQLVANLLSMVGIILTMFLLNVWLALSSLIIVPLQVIVTLIIGRKTLAGFRSLQGNLGSLNSMIEETISGQKIISAYNQQTYYQTRFQKINTDVMNNSISALQWALLIQPIVTVLSNFGIVTVVGVGAWLSIRGLVTIGTITAFISYARSFAQPLRGIGELYNSVQTALAGAERVFEILDTRPEIVDSYEACFLDKFDGEIVFHDVDFEYVPSVPVLRNINLKAEPGEMIAIVGPTGAGKTTIINLLTRFYDIPRGVITIDGYNVKKIGKACLRRELGLVLQDIILFSGTVMENIRYGRLEATDDECIEAAKLANAHQFIVRLPKGYQTELAGRGENLSLGQRQLLSIARAILADPSVLILDEATSSVDTRTESQIQQALLNLMKGKTSFIIAHRLSTIRNADQIIVINNGEIIEKGTHEELLSKEGFYHKLYLSQFKGKVNMK